jgi:hypothetical protein
VADEKSIEVTEEMILKGCEVIVERGGVHFNPYVSSPEDYAVIVNDIVKAVLYSQQSDL